MDHCAFIGLDDISDGLPSYHEEVVPVAMEQPLKAAYEQLEEEITACLKEHRGNSSVAGTMLNALLAWPDHPYGFGTLYGSEFNPETKCRERFVIAETVDLDKSTTYAKERALIEEVKAQLARGRKCQVFAVYTNKYDVTERLAKLVSCRRNSRCHPAGERAHPQARGLVPRAVAAWHRRRDLPSEDRGDGPRSAGFSDHPVSRNGLFAAHAAAGQPPFVAHRTKASPWK